VSTVLKRDPVADALALRLREVTARLRAQNDRLEGVTAGTIAPRSAEEIARDGKAAR
jgi:hypothetical protein